jgi:hypothetical protein
VRNLPEQTAAIDWTCERCEVTASWMAGTARPELPKGWVVEESEVYCLNCRRERASENVEIAEDVPAAERQKLRSQARIEFEIRREPELPDNRIAKACHTSPIAVRKARLRIGVPAPPRT